MKDFLAAKKSRQKLMDEHKIMLDEIKKEEIKKKLEEEAKKKQTATWTPDPGRDYTDKELSDIGRKHFTGKGMAFEKRNTGTGKGPRKDGGLMGKGGSRFKSYFDGGIVSLRRR